MVSFLLLIAAARIRENNSTGVQQSADLFRINSKLFAADLTDLEKSLMQLDSTRPETIQHAKQSLQNSRIAYKRIEYLLEYFFYTSSRIYNRAPKNEIEEPFLEYQQPAGLQYIETLLFDSSPEKYKEELLTQIRFVLSSAHDLNSLLYNFKATDAQILESVRIELVRVISLGIAGFDAPRLKSGILESETSLQNLRQILKPYLNKKSPKAESVSYCLENSILFLHQNADFDTFNRMVFLTAHALPLQNALSNFIRDQGLEMNRDNILNYKAEHLFTRDAFNMNAFSGTGKSDANQTVSPGKKLFFETKLSGNETKSCASCHDPDNYFMDGLAKSIGFDPKTYVKRNAPSLLYASMQHSQFWDGRAKTLEHQIENVIKNSLEMHGNMPLTLTKLNNTKSYRKAFNKKRTEKITESEIYQAIASYVRTLTPYNSAFDQYIKGDKKALTENQIAGFNLFMGKAQCGTCHFAPLFNGLIPPLYKLTEFEVLGTTKTDILLKAEPDADQGRFVFKPIRFYQGAFKTPTVRNSAKTAPYMHNGAFQSLDILLEFYNQGGGAGLGLDLPNQTLSASHLNLSNREKSDIIEFLGALTDDVSTKKN
ncbi:cytochrome-c peroxidase [Dyadobacter psychrotolerans]|uniref:Cytochrome C peroxidase n=1 Tax=Dyadobacter psychrotolerans TaxID=2541721 RepID=A0A4R5DN23_9BACT|nr:cytochrome c peroxidase [Dyadobacter psychrotolerans]TDE15716.1 cytochrome C peroxidase [Dyadobacter psychrotolerans]